MRRVHFDSNVRHCTARNVGGGRLARGDVHGDDPGSACGYDRVEQRQGDVLSSVDRHQPDDANVASLTIAPPTTRADLSISIDDSPDPVGVRETVTYTLTVKNGGPGLATGVIVTDQLPSTLTFVAAESTQGSCSRTAGVVTCAIGTLAKNGKAKIKIKVTTTAAGKFPNTASVAGAQPDPHNADNTDSVTTHVIGPRGH